ncbi:MAG TPA: squalene/phytoene synthase family protein [Thermomicrobiaceae bacterium]|nr:squalene/phytoene synthase family protein [Thermomicrobiaceae bacterium]
MSALSALVAADSYCRVLAARHYENFSVASRILPPEARRHLARIYAYCRTTDDLGDERSGDSLARLAEWRALVLRAFDEPGEPLHPVLLALRPTIRAFALPPEPFLDLIAANVQDQTTTRYEEWDALHAYCTRSAAPVGRLVLRVFGVRQPAADRLSDDVCIGLQLANFAQDVRRDGERGRVYLLQQVLRREGSAAAVRDLCDRAARLLDSGRELEALVPGRLGVQLALYRLGGAAVVAAIRRGDYRTDQVRPRVTAPARTRILAAALLERGRRHADVRTELPADRWASVADRDPTAAHDTSS